ncbi:MAG: hypothetical protein ACK5O7_02980 [Holosporales bacterium]
MCDDEVAYGRASLVCLSRHCEERQRRGNPCALGLPLHQRDKNSLDPRLRGDDREHAAWIATLGSLARDDGLGVRMITGWCAVRDD